MSGALIVGQSGGVTPVINASLAGVIAAATGAKRFDRVLGMRHGVRGLLENDLVPLQGLGERQLRRLRDTPGAWLGSCRFAPVEAQLEQMLAVLRAEQVHTYVYIGGNDSADTSARLAALATRQGYDLSVINVPKTIDNDLAGMDHCPGYPTAAAYVALSTALLCLDTRAMRREEPVRVIEVKGRHSGWLAAAAAAFEPSHGGRPLFIYMPEQPLHAARVLADVEAGVARAGYAVLVVSEHAVDAAGRPVGEGASVYRDEFGHDDSPGPGSFLQSLVQTDLKRRCRLEVLGAMQKVALLPSVALDREEAFAAGQHAVALALAGESGCCVTVGREPGAAYRACYGRTGLDHIARSERLLPDIFLANGQPSQPFRDWLRPLIAETHPLVERLLDTEA